jgi:hypothetical protein
MFLLKTLWVITTFVVFLAVDFSARAQLKIVSGSEPQRVFAGAEREVLIDFYNPDGQDCTREIRTRLVQVSSSAAVVLAEKKWKQIEILAGQTVQETTQVDFPAVNAETRFLIQWMEGTNRVIGKTEVLAYPTNLLGELKPLLGEEHLGVLDPNDKLKPVLKQNHLNFLDLGEMSLEDFHGKLAILGPFESKAQIRADLKQSVQKIASKGVTVVWIQPPLMPKDELTPSFYTVPEGLGAVVVVESGLVANFAENPRSQLNLVSLCKLALKPKLPVLPNLNVQ